MKDDQYILPYQILAYANFLSNNRDVATQYFLKLADFDAANKANYIFLVGVSQYRMGDYDQSVLYLNQVTDPLLLTDVYRYELLSSLA
jgi:tetratricopeptide (TPR) repeat protein